MKRKARVLTALPKAAPKFLEPMKCRLCADLPTGPNWLYEIKFDGYRGLALKDGDEARLISRTNKDLGSRFPGVVQALVGLDCDQVVGSSRVDLQACKLEYSIVSPK